MSTPDSHLDHLLAVLDAELARRGIKAPADTAWLERAAARLEPRLARAFRAAVVAAKGKVSAQDLEAAVRAANPAEVVSLYVNAGIWTTLEPAAQEALFRAAQAGGRAAVAMGELNLSFDLIDAKAVEWASTRTASLIVEVTETQRDVVRGIITRSVSGEFDVRSAARLISDVIGLDQRRADAVEAFRARLGADGIDPAIVDTRTERYAEAQLRQRSKLIARTEIIDSATAGQNLLWQEAKKQGLLDPERTRRVWLATHDDRLDTQICEPLDGVETGLDEAFPGGYFRPPAHPG